MEPGFRPKLGTQLEHQLHRAQQLVGQDSAYSLIPPAISETDMMQMPLAEIQTRFRRRYELYLDILRHEQQMQHVPESEQTDVLSQEELADMRKWLGALNNLDRYITDHTEGSVERTLRDRQFTVFEDMRNFVEGGGHEGYVKLPTGVGKTVLFTEFLEAMNLRTIIVVPTQVLVGQTQKKIEQFAPDIQKGKIYARAKELGRQVTIITYDSLIDGLKQGNIKPEEFDLMILDEAHLALGKERTNAIKQFKQAIKLGFTATPEYSEEKQVSNLLPNEIHRMEIREAVEEGLLAPFAAMIARTNADLSKVKVTSSGEYEEEDLARAVNVESRNQSAVQLYLDKFFGESTITFCSGVNHAKEMARLFNEAGVVAEAISGSTSLPEQKRILREYTEGKIQILCNADLLIAGFDEPRASVCLNLRPTRSRVAAEQRAGRVLRLDENNPDKFARIVDFLDAKYNKKTPPVLFAAIAGAAKIENKKKLIKTAIQTAEDKQHRDHRDKPFVRVQGLEVTVNAEEVLRIVAQLEQEMILNLTPDDIRNTLIQESVTPLNWISLTTAQRKRIDVNGLKLAAIARIFGIEENPTVRTEIFIDLCRAIFGQEVVDDAVHQLQVLKEKEKQAMPEVIRTTLKEQGITAKDWIHMTTALKKKIEIQGLKLNAIARIFGIMDDPINSAVVFIDLCRAIFGEDEVNKILEKEQLKTHICMILEQQGVRAEQWVRMTGDQRKQIMVDGLDIRTISKLLTIAGDPVKNTDVFLNVCRVIFGEEVVDSIATRKRAVKENNLASELVQAQVRAALQTERVSVKDWIGMTAIQRSSLKINAHKLTSLARIFGVQGDPVGHTDVFEKLCRQIFGEDAVDKAKEYKQLEVIAARDKELLEKQKKICDTLRIENVTAQDWVNMSSRQRNQVQVNGLKLNGIARIFKIDGSPIVSTAIFLDLCRAIFGDEEVDKVLQKK